MKEPEVYFLLKASILLYRHSALLYRHSGAGRNPYSFDSIVL